MYYIILTMRGCMGTFCPPIAASSVSRTFVRTIVKLLEPQT